MQLPIDIDFRTMTEASLNNLVTGCHRTDGHLRREFYRCESLARSAKNDMERDKWYLEQLDEAKEQLYTIHDAMERCLDKIDKIYNTNFAPTGAQRLY